MEKGIKVNIRQLNVDYFDVINNNKKGRSETPNTVTNYTKNKDTETRNNVGDRYM
jgi:hypothetical protein